MTYQSLQTSQLQDISFSETMSYLPAKILDDICGSIHFDTLPNFRLASKMFAAVSARYLLQVIHFTYFPFESFIKFECISEHSTLRQQVKVILYQGDWPATGDRCNNPGRSCSALLDSRHMDGS